MRTGRTVVITGAAGGMGALFVERLLANGDTVITTDMTEEGLAGLTDESGRPRRITANLTEANHDPSV